MVKSFLGLMRDYISVSYQKSFVTVVRNICSKSARPLSPPVLRFIYLQCSLSSEAPALVSHICSLSSALSMALGIQPMVECEKGFWIY